MLQLRPHHLIDIIRNIGQKRPIEPHPYGHAQHIITQAILDGRVHEIRFIVGADDLCKPCIHLTGEGLCNDVLPQLEFRVLKQEYNDALDRRVLEFLDLEEGTVIHLKDFLGLMGQHLNELAKICTHPKEDEGERRVGLEIGMGRVGNLMI
jgi:hypothetical protein